MAEIRYIVDDVDAALDFYTTRLGFELVERLGPPFASIRRGDLTVWISGPRTSARRAMPDGRQPVPGGWNRIVLQVQDLQTTVDSLRDAGATFRNDIVTGPGGKQILVEDPSGNPIELFQSG